MIEKNFIKLLPWSVEKDNFGSEYKVIDNDIIAVKLKKAKQINNNFTYIKIKIYPDNSYNDKYFEIPKSNGFIITYKNTNNNEIIFYIEQDSNKYLYYILPPSKEWVTKKIKLIHMKNDNNIKPDLNNISNFKFALNSNLKDEISDTLYIKEFFISKYEIVLKKTKNIITNKFIMKRNILNNLKSFFFKTKLEKYKIFDSVGNPLYCINPFYLF